MIHGDTDYALARLHARAADRARRGNWLQFSAARSLGAAIEQLRGAGVGHWVEGLTGGSEPHAMEALLRQRFRERVCELARWADPRWQSALHWCAHLVDLPALRAASIRRDAAPSALPAPAAPARLAINDPMHAIDERLDAELRRRLPALGSADRAEFERLAQTIAIHRRRFAALPAGNGWPEREDLERKLQLRLRRTPLSPVHLLTAVALLLLDFERVRGQLLALGALPVESPP